MVVDKNVYKHPVVFLVAVMSSCLIHSVFCILQVRNIMILQFQGAHFFVTVEEVHVGVAFDIAVGRYD